MPDGSLLLISRTGCPKSKIISTLFNRASSIVNMAFAQVDADLGAAGSAGGLREGCCMR